MIRAINRPLNEADNNLKIFLGGFIMSKSEIRERIETYEQMQIFAEEHGHAAQSYNLLLKIMKLNEMLNEMESE